MWNSTRTHLNTCIALYLNCFSRLKPAGIGARLTFT